MVRHQPTDAGYLGLRKAKFGLGGIAGNHREVPVIFFTQQFGDSAQLWASGSQHRRPPWLGWDRNIPPRRRF